MVKMMFLWRDRTDQPPEESLAHYRATHMVLARKAYDGVEGFRKLVFNRVVSHHVNDFNKPELRPEKPDFDAFVELWFDSAETMAAASKRPEFAALFADHPNFMEIDQKANIRAYELEEEVILAAD